MTKIDGLKKLSFAISCNNSQYFRNIFLPVTGTNKVEKEIVLGLDSAHFLFLFGDALIIMAIMDSDDILDKKNSLYYYHTLPYFHKEEI